VNEGRRTGNTCGEQEEQSAHERRYAPYRAAVKVRHELFTHWFRRAKSDSDSSPVVTCSLVVDARRTHECVDAEIRI